MIDVKDGYELGLLFRVMSNIDIGDYMAAGLNYDTACLLLGPDKFRTFIILEDKDQEKAASVIMQRYQPQAKRARLQKIKLEDPENGDDDWHDQWERDEFGSR